MCPIVSVFRLHNRPYIICLEQELFQEKNICGLNRKNFILNVYSLFLFHQTTSIFTLFLFFFYNYLLFDVPALLFFLLPPNTALMINDD